MRALAKLAWSLLLLASGTAGADPAATLAGAAPAFERVGQIGGETLAVAIAGTFPYVPTVARVAVLDVSDPSRPIAVASYQGRVESLAVAGSSSYLGLGPGGVEIVRRPPG